MTLKLIRSLALFKQLESLLEPDDSEGREFLPAEETVIPTTKEIAIPTAKETIILTTKETVVPTTEETVALTTGNS